MTFLLRFHRPAVDVPTTIPVSATADPYTIPFGWTAPNGAKIVTRNYGTTSNGKVLRNAAGDTTLIAKTTGQALDARIDAYAYNGVIMLGLNGGGNFFYLRMAQPAALADVGYVTGANESGALSGPNSANGTWTSLNPTGYTSLGTYPATVAVGYLKDDNTRRWGLERSGLDLIVYYNGVEVYRIVNAHWYAPGVGATGFASGLASEGFAGPITASFPAAPTLLSDRLNKVLNLADLSFKPIVTTGAITAGTSTLTLTSNPGITVGDNIAVEPGWVSVTSAVKASGANTGNGFLRVSTSHHVLDGYRTGAPAYKVRVTSKATRTFTVTRAVDDSVVGTGTYGSAFNPAEGPGPEFATEVAFTLNEGQLPTWNDVTNTYVPAVVVPFENGDGFDITISVTGETALAPWDSSPSAGRLGTIGVGGTYPALSRPTPADFAGFSRAGLVGGTGTTTSAYAVSNGLRYKLLTQAVNGVAQLNVPSPDWAAHFSTNTATPRTITFTRPTITNGTTITAVSATNATGYLPAGTTVGALLATTVDYDRYAISQNHTWTGSGIKQQTVALLGGTRWNPIGLDPAARGEIRVYTGVLGQGALFEASSCIAPGTMVTSVSWPTATIDQDVTATGTNISGVAWWWNQNYNYYYEKAFPRPLLAVVTAVSGAGNTVLTLDRTATASTSGANVYVDSSPLWAARVAPVPLSGMSIVIPAGTYGQSAGWITTSSKTNWTLTGAGRTQTILKNVRGGTSQIMAWTSPNQLTIQDMAGTGLHTTNGLGATYNPDGNTDQGFGYGFSISGGFNNVIRRVNVSDTIQTAIGLPNNDSFLVDDVAYTSNYSYQNYLAQWQIQAPNNTGASEFRNVVGTSVSTMPMWQTFNGGTGSTCLWTNIDSTNGFMAHNSTGGQNISDSTFRFLPYAIDISTREPGHLNNPAISSNQNAATGFGGAGISTGTGMNVANTNVIQVGYATRFGDVFQAITAQPPSSQTFPTDPIFTITGTYDYSVKDDGARKGLISGPVRAATANGQGTASTTYGTSAGTLWVRMTGPGVLISGIRVRPYHITGVTETTYPPSEGFKDLNITPSQSSSLTNTITGFAAAEVLVNGTPVGTTANNISNTAYDALP